MIRRVVKIQLIAFVLLGLAAMTYAGANDAGLLTRHFTVVAELPNAGGIFPNAEVAERGVDVGKVGAITLTRRGAAVHLQINAGERIPADSFAHVANLSAVGEEYVNLVPPNARGPYLHAGSVIPASRTSVPLSDATLLENLNTLVNSVNRRDLVTVVDNLDSAFAGTGPDLARLITTGDALTTSVTAALPATIQLINASRTVLATAQATSGAFANFAAHLAQLSAQVRSSDPSLVGVFDHGVLASQQLQSLLATNAPTLPVLLGNLLTLGDIQLVRLPGLQQLLITYPTDIANGFYVVPGDGTAHFGLQTSSSGGPCTNGYQGTRGNSPKGNTHYPPNTKAYCNEPIQSSIDVLGSRNVPRPPGDYSDPALQPGGAAAGAALASPSGSVAVTPAVAGYDPNTGFVVAPGGQTAFVNPNSSSDAALLGKDSWEWMLLAPLGA